VELFLTLLALLAMSLAAVAFIRSVDTSTLIAGNLAFKQAATSAGDSSLENAINWLAATELANSAKNALNDATHPFNKTGSSAGYYSSLDTTKSLTDPSVTPHFSWPADSSAPVTDTGGNKTRYIIQRMCRLNDTVVQNNECLFGGVVKLDGKERGIQYPPDICNGPGCPLIGQSTQFRITVRTEGPKNSITYVQAFAY
jgi:Tfp pilus assembly protein PilX